jgi:acyl-coenzyme A synthetase/AMP-(fatty) acid ligase
MPIWPRLLHRIAPGFVIGDAERVGRLAPGDGHVTRSRAAFVEAAEQAADAPEDDSEPAEEIAVQLFTSGTTAAAQGGDAAPWQSHCPTSWARSSSAPPSRKRRRWSAVPPYHIAGIAALLSSIYAMRRILLLRQFRAGCAGWSWPLPEQATSAFLVPTMLARIIEHHG